MPICECFGDWKNFLIFPVNAENLKVEGVEGFSEKYEEGLMLAQDLMVDFGDEAMVLVQQRRLWSLGM